MRLWLFLAVLAAAIAPAEAREMRIVALGDSLTSGFGLQKGDDFATRLQTALREKGVDARVENAGVPGNTAEDGAKRLDGAIAGDQRPDLVIVALGANDMLRRIDPEKTKEMLEVILQTLKDKNVPVLLAGMKDPRLPGFLVKDRYAAVYKDLANNFDVEFYPFFLKDVALKPDLNLPDGIHPNAEGINVIVKNILPSVQDALER